MERLNLQDGDPPVYLMIIPPFSSSWVEQMESIGAVRSSDALKARLADLDPQVARKMGWEIVGEMEKAALDSGASGVVLMGLKFSSIVEEAPRSWPDLE
jgi:5,10-methylenetetrahydrofolate reductase